MGGGRKKEKRPPPYIEARIIYNNNALSFIPI